MVSDTLRHEARVIREAAERVATQMLLCENGAQEAHKIVRAAQRLVGRAEDVIYSDHAGHRFQKVFSDDLKELKEALADGEPAK
jgi:hypothetical protein